VAEARKRHAPPDGPLVVFAGRLVYEKGVQTLLDALPALRATHPGIRLLVAGTGVYEDQLQSRARRRRLARAVEWAGFVPEVDLAAILGAADLVVVPSLYEPFGIVALEASAARTPLVVARTGGLDDLVEARIATQSFPPGDVPELTEAIRGVLDDPGAARRHAQRAARAVRSRYAWSAVATQTAAVYASAAAPR
jgi:glycogen(starch) synthase